MVPSGANAYDTDESRRVDRQDSSELGLNNKKYQFLWIFSLLKPDKGDRLTR